MSYGVIALLMFSGMMLLLLTGQRVFAVIGFVGAIMALLLWGEGGIEMPFTAIIKLMKWYPLLTLPLFVFMGYMLAESRIADDLYRMFHVWMGPVRGGLAIGTIFMMVIISAINGLSVAGLAVGATIALPELLRRGYDKVMTTGVIMAGSTLGILIPPSVVLVLYGMIARQPVGNLWMAGVFPGLLMATLFVLYVVIRSWLQPDMAPALSKAERDEYSLGDKLRLLRAGLIPLGIFLTMTGLFLAGITSLVESSAVGVIGSIVAAWLRGTLTLKVLHDTTRKTMGISAMFFWIITAALCFGAVFDGLGAVKSIEWLFIGEWGLQPWMVLVLMQATFLILGIFLDDTAMLVIVAPLFIPLAGALGFDLVWYGVLYTITCQIAYLTPPFGYNLFLMRAMAPPEVTLTDIYRSISPFVAIMLLTLIIIGVFPEIATWLPNYVYGK
ncbi:MAG: TRAP transporter large permease subunit [Rhizobiaceae bacterium]|nr:TRAP transporter large permease subunit [Rhizobiaceae bacterium]